MSVGNRVCLSVLASLLCTSLSEHIHVWRWCTLHSIPLSSQLHSIIFGGAYIYQHHPPSSEHFTSVSCVLPPFCLLANPWTCNCTNRCNVIHWQCQCQCLPVWFPKQVYHCRATSTPWAPSLLLQLSARPSHTVISCLSMHLCRYWLTCAVHVWPSPSMLQPDQWRRSSPTDYCRGEVLWSSNWRWMRRSRRRRRRLWQSVVQRGRICTSCITPCNCHPVCFGLRSALHCALCLIFSIYKSTYPFAQPARPATCATNTTSAVTTRIHMFTCKLTHNSIKLVLLCVELWFSQIFALVFAALLLTCFSHSSLY